MQTLMKLFFIHVTQKRN